MTAAAVHVGDCRDVLRTLDDCSVDSVVTDPPAGIAFMNKSWDRDMGGRNVWIAWMTDVMRECLRVVKPGGHAFVWSLPRTSHWTAMAIEDAGFEIRDTVSHIFGQGFPKSKNIGNGWGTALKPAREDWILARKPLAEPSVAANVARFETGALNIAATRVGTTRDVPASHSKTAPSIGVVGIKANRVESELDPNMGRWPPNLVLSHSAACARVGVKRVRGNSGGPRIPAAGWGWEAGGTRPQHADATGHETVEDWRCAPGCPVRVLDMQSGYSASGESGYDWRESNNDNPTHVIRNIKSGVHFGDTGGASRFFPIFRPDPPPFLYVAKASRAERERGLEGMPEQLRKMGGHGNNEQDDLTLKLGSNIPAANHHPTVKPIALMRWLVRLVTPRGGIVLDPFCGSGSTGVACVDEGMQFIGIEREVEYAELARLRIEAAQVIPLLREVG